MSETTFDTLKYAKKLIKAGFTEQQAEVQAEAIKELIDDKLATKRDLKVLKDQLTIRFGTMLATVVIVLAAIIKF